MDGMVFSIALVHLFMMGAKREIQSKENGRFDEGLFDVCEAVDVVEEIPEGWSRQITD